jgi:serine/threonine protein kinase
MANYHYTGGEMIVEKVQLTNLDNAAYLPNGRYIKSMTAGNENWRSPETFFKSKINKPTDMFAFGIVVSPAPQTSITPVTNTFRKCIYVVLRHVILGHNADFQKHEQLGALPDMIRLQRLVSYFVDQEGFEGQMRHLGDDETSRTVLTMLWEDRHEAYILYRSFADWPDMEDGVFKDLVVRFMNLDPERRITAQETLERLRFEGI